MRHVPTDAEIRVWSHLRDRRLKGWKFRRQHPIGGFILDFYCPDACLGIELDGGGHALPEQAARDQERERRLSESGVRLLRFWDDQALKETDTVLETVLKALENPPHPTLSPKGERGSSLLSSKAERAGQVSPSPCKGEGQG